MARSARRREPRRAGLLRSGAAAVGAAISQNPTIVGGATAFLVTFFFVSANALWYQPYAHRNAFFATRDIVSFPSAMSDGDPGEAETTFVIEREPPRPEPPKSDPLVEKVQQALVRLNLYAGPVDGLRGPQTRHAVEQYQRILGVKITGEINELLLAQMEAGLETMPAVDATSSALPTVDETRFIVPIPTPAPRGQSAVPAVSTETVAATSTPQADPRIVRVQAGLRAFGNDGIEIDGVIGSKTKAAIREFQSLFGLPVTGEVDDVLYAKMQEVGLTN